MCCTMQACTNLAAVHGSSRLADFSLACVGGQWEEPWDQKSALKTIQKLERHWYQLDGTSTSMRPSTGADEAEEGSGDPSGSDDEGPPKKQLKASVNKVCGHVACSAQTVCLVEQLQTVRDNYRGRIDQFRIKVRSFIVCHAEVAIKACCAASPLHHCLFVSFVAF